MRTRLTRRTIKVAASAATATVGMALFATSASAHVSIDTLGTVEQGSFAKLGFSVPNERDDAGTVEVKVQFPQDHPLAFVSVQPKVGWDIATTTRTLATPVEAEGASISEVVDTVTWTAAGDTQIKPGEFDVFWVSAGEMPTDVDSLSFPTIQTYSGGEEVAWIDPAPADGSEAEHPIPTVGLVSSSGESDGHGSADTAGNSDAPAEGEGDTEDDDSNTVAIIALVVGALGLVAGATGIMIARKASAGGRTTG